MIGLKLAKIIFFTFMKTKITSILLALTLLNACRRETDVVINNTTPTDVNSMNDLKVPNGFNYESSVDKDFNIRLLDPQGNPYKRAIIKIMDNSYEKKGAVLLTGSTDDDGYFRAKGNIPTLLTDVIINTNALSIPQDILIASTSGQINAVLGGPNFTPRTVPSTILGKTGSMGKAIGKLSTKLGTWNSNGKPNYLTADDVVGASFLSAVSTFLPESNPLPNRFPAFLDDNFYRRNLVLTGTTDVWVTFVSEGAGYKNAMFYYVYNKNTPPTNMSQIDSFYLIFPNTSFSGSGGELATGNRVKLGTFGKDTVVAFGIVQNGFTNGSVDVSRQFFFGNKELNPETTNKQHLALVKDPATERYLLAFEDLNRDPGQGSDEDFNDVVYYATATPASNVLQDDIPILPAPKDTDGDGIDDNNDEYPTDPTKAFNNYYPNSKDYATVAFEDLWNSRGDYDMNDAVIDVRTNAITNASNNVVRFEGKYVLRASGGGFRNAFVVEYPVVRGNVSGVTGATLETGTTNACLQLFSSTRAIQQQWNTWPGNPYSDSVLFDVSFNITTPPSLSSFGLSAYNPFIWVNEPGKGRGWEIHLPGKNPTNLANTALFGQGDDDTQVNGTKKYLSKNNLPWAISIPEKFDYPKETEDITQTYLRFVNWAQSGGTTNTDWYKNISGYRVNSKIYVKP